MLYENCSNECVCNKELQQLEYMILLLLSDLAQPLHMCRTNRRDTYKDAFPEESIRRAPDLSTSECTVCPSALTAIPTFRCPSFQKLLPYQDNACKEKNVRCIMMNFDMPKSTAVGVIWQFAVSISSRSSNHGRKLITLACPSYQAKRNCRVRMMYARTRMYRDDRGCRSGEVCCRLPKILVGSLRSN